MSDFSFSDIRRMAPPPETPNFPGSDNDFESVQERLGLRLPLFLKEYGATYGTGSFISAGGSVAFSIWNPFDPRFIDSFESTCQVLRDQYEEYAASGWSDDFPLAPYPLGTLFPVGLAVSFTYLCCHRPEAASEVIYLVRGNPIEFTKYDCDFWTTIGRFLSGEDIGLWPPSAYERPFRFRTDARLFR